MTKHLYFNPKEFDQLVLSGVLIELLKSDIEVHSHDDGEMLRFVQGENVVEGNIENILRFANTISKHRIFGHNWQQQAVINMINGVCRDIERKLPMVIQSSQLVDKIEYLNQYWFNKSSRWLFRGGFYSCHMEILTLSFLIQQKFPDLLIKYQCFIQLRKLFIEQKLLSKPSLIAMFTHPENKYQEYDLFPQIEQSTNDVRRSMGSQYGDQVTHQNNYQQIVDNQNMEIVNEFIHLHSQEHHLNDNEHHIIIEQTHQTSYAQSSEKYPSRLSPQNIVISKLQQNESVVVVSIPSEILKEISIISEIQIRQQEEQIHQHQNQNENQQNQKVTQENSHEIVVVVEDDRTAEDHQRQPVLIEKERMSQQQHDGENQLIVNNQENIIQQAYASQQVENKPPRQQSNRGSINGPKSAMNTKIRAKQQSAIVHKETCKCEIF